MYADISLFESLQNAACPVRNDVRTGQVSAEPDEDEQGWGATTIHYDDLSPSQEHYLMGLVSPMGARDDLSLDDLKRLIPLIQQCKTPEEKKRVCEAYGIPYDYDKKNFNLLASAAKMFGGTPRYKPSKYDKALEDVRLLAKRGDQALIRSAKKRAVDKNRLQYEERIRRGANQPKQYNPYKPCQWISLGGMKEDLQKLVEKIMDLPLLQNNPETQQKILDMIGDRVRAAYRASDGKKIPYDTYHSLVTGIQHEYETLAGLQKNGM